MLLNTLLNYIDDTKVVSCSVEKLLIIWQVKLVADNSGKYEAVELQKIESKNYMDLALS